MQPSDGGNYWRGDEEKDGTSLPEPQPVPDAPLPPPDEPEPEEDEDEQDEPFDPVSWDASEYIHHERDGLWFMGFIVVTLGLMALSIFVIKNYFFTALILVMAVALFLYARRPPHVLHYTLSAQGLNIGQKFHFFNEFRAFGIVQDGALFSVKLLPTARFGQELTVYFAENDGENIVDILGAYLPMEDLKLDLVDAMLRRLRL